MSVLRASDSVMWCPVVSCRVLSCPVLPCHALSCSALSCLQVVIKNHGRLHDCLLLRAVDDGCPSLIAPPLHPRPPPPGLLLFVVYYCGIIGDRRKA